MQACELVNLADLDTGAPHVRATLTASLEDLLSLGVDASASTPPSTWRRRTSPRSEVVTDAGTLDPGELCDVLLGQFDSAERGDDVAVLAVHLTGERHDPPA